MFSGSFLAAFYKLFVPGSSMAQATAQNAELHAVLDGAQQATEQRSAAEDGSNADASMDLYSEHLARLRAEAEVQDKAARLRVAQEQLAEYATDKSAAAAAVLEQAAAVEAMLQRLMGSTDSGPAGPEVAALAEQLGRLKQQLADGALEAKAFAEQQRADVERLKRSSEQAELMAVDNDVDMKRPREANGVGSDDDVQDAPANGHDAAAEEAADGDEQAADEDSMDHVAAGVRGGVSSTSYPTGSFRERALYIPLRLKLEERRLLRLLEASLNVSEYTDKVDVLTWRNKHGRIHAQIVDLCAILSGLVVAQDYKKGQSLVVDRNFADNAEFFQAVFEIGRRYKIQNPDKMRSEYGKLMYMLMDSSDRSVQELLEFKCVRPLQTVVSFLQDRGGDQLLDDPLMGPATAEIIAGQRSRYEVQRDIKAKEKAREALARKYRSNQLSQEDILWCIYSIADNSSFLLFNRDPIDRMIHYFTANFKPDTFEPECSLAITGGRAGARLTHNHERQYHYVLQSLTLWREIANDMFKLWYLAESDMLRENNGYRLCDTGQGLNRVQSAPGVSRAMHAILGRVQARIGSWVGSSVVHLGDHNVPNALMFIDKYTQVPRILNPVVAVLDQLPQMYKDEDIKLYIDSSFGGVEGCRKSILVDFCRHAFDGSGSDNFFDAGSCIDGRLTSAWNWCSKLEKKQYYWVFKLAGFNGFDGDFKH